MTARGQETVNKILDATLSILRTQGYSGLTTNHVAALSGIKVGSLYRFFTNKEAIVIALIERWQSSIIKTIDTYILQQPATMSFTQILQGLILINAEQEYSDNAAYQEVILAASTVPVLKTIAKQHRMRIARRLLPVYKRHSSGRKTQAEVLEFSEFLHGLISAALSELSDLTPKARARQMVWLNEMVASAVNSFEST